MRIPEGEPQSLPGWAQLGLDETPLQYAPKLRGGYAAGEEQVTHYSSADKRQATATHVVNCEGTVKVLQVLQRGKPSCHHARGPRAFWRHMIFFLKTYGRILNIPHRGGNGRRSRPSRENWQLSAFS